MPEIVDAPIAARRWQDALRRSAERLDRTLDTLGCEECDWAPDDGIPTAREHLWAIADNERSLTSILSRGTVGTSGCEASDLEFDEIRRILTICRRNLHDWLATRDAASLEPEVEEMLLAHLELKAHHTAAIGLLSKLIDPSREVPQPS